MTSELPFIKKFKTNNNYFIYDVCTNQIILVDPITYDVMGDWGQLPKHALIEKWKNVHDENKINICLDEIQNVIRINGFFSVSRPNRLESSWKDEVIRTNLDNKIEQLILNVTEQCNLRCSYCVYSGKYAYQREHCDRHMDFSTAKKAIDFFIEHSKKSNQIALGFYGGEPLLNFDIIMKSIEYFKTKTKHLAEVYITLTTNGTLLRNEIAAYLLENHVRIVISFDGPKEIHNRFRKYKNGLGSHSTIWENINRLRADYPNEYYKYVSFNVLIGPPYKIMEVHDFFQNNRSLFNNKLQISFVDPHDTNFFEDFGNDNTHVHDYENLKSKFIELSSQEKINEDQFLKRCFERRLLKIFKRKFYKTLCSAHFPNGICLPGTRRLFVHVDGRLSPCERVNDSLIIGDIENGFDYEKISSLISEYSSISKDDCINCWALRLCTSCFVQIFRREMDIERKRLFCRQERSNLEMDLIMYCSILERNARALDYMNDITIS